MSTLFEIKFLKFLKSFGIEQFFHVLGQIGGKCHLYSGYRMEKAKLVRMKRLPADQFHIRVVQIISDQRESEMLHVDADLVRASCL